MLRRGRVRPSKASSIMGMVVGIVFVFVGVTSIIPFGGAFGIVWTLMALAITGFHAYNAFSERGFAFYQVDVEDRGEMMDSTNDFDIKLRKLKKLRDDGIISEEEYEEKRQEVMRDKW